MTVHVALFGHLQVLPTRLGGRPFPLYSGITPYTSKRIVDPTPTIGNREWWAVWMSTFFQCLKDFNAGLGFIFANAMHRPQAAVHSDHQGASTGFALIPLKPIFFRFGFD